MTASYFDKEVEKYLGFGMSIQQQHDDTTRRCCSAVTPGRLKGIDSSRRNIKRPVSACSVLSPERRTPSKFESTNCYRRTPKSKRDRNGNANSSKKKTPSSKIRTPKTPKESDRFIPPRGSMNFASCHHKIMQTAVVNNENDTALQRSSNSPVKKEIKAFEQGMTDNINRVLGESNTRILQYQSKTNTPIKGHGSQEKTVQGTLSSTKKKPRKIPLVPERVLDAPNYIDDYYLNLLHWSTSVDLLAVALDNSVYVWTPSTGDINHICELDEPESYVTSIQWVEQGNQLAVGTVNGCVQLWDIEQKKRLRQMAGHAARVSCLSWNTHILSSGSRSGAIHNHDVRVVQHHISSFTSHTQEVCGLQWSPTRRYLASGSNNNKVSIWDWNQSGENGAPVHCFNQHRAAVKALSWCPWQHHILASGGGAADKTIRFWNVNSGNCINTVETDSQVSSILWNGAYKELISGHGHPNNQLSIWNYPSMTKKADLLGHTSRVLQMTMSPDKTRVMSGAGDETLRLWHCFELTKDKKKEKVKTNDADNILSMTNIR